MFITTSSSCPDYKVYLDRSVKQHQTRTSCKQCRLPLFTLSVSCIGIGSPLRDGMVTGATTLSRLLYTSPAWWGLTSAEDRGHLELFLRKLQRHQFLPLLIGSIAEAADVRLLLAVVASDPYVFHQFSYQLPKRRIICVLEVILFFSLLRMTVSLFQEYHLNNNIYDITLNNMFKETLKKLTAI